MTPTANHGIMPATDDCEQCGQTIVIEDDNLCNDCSDASGNGEGPDTEAQR